jgi:hypothetical protein
MVSAAVKLRAQKNRHGKATSQKRIAVPREANFYEHPIGESE